MASPCAAFTASRFHTLPYPIMSATAHPKRLTCAYCDGDRDADSSVKGSFCSSECYYKHKGDKALNILRHDHRLCPSCGRWLKTVETPSSEWINDHGSALHVALDNGGEITSRNGQQILDATECSDVQPTQVDAIKGVQDRTEHAESAVKEFEGQAEDSRIYRLGTGCECGITNPTERDSDLQTVELEVVLANYVKRCRELEAEGQLSERIDKGVFFQTYKESRDLLFSLGKALYG